MSYKIPIYKVNLLIGIGSIIIFSMEIYRLFLNEGCSRFIGNIEKCGNWAIVIHVVQLGVGGLFLLAGIRGMRGDRKYMEKSHLICKNCEAPHNVYDNFESCKECGGELVPLEGFYNSGDKDTEERKQ